MSTIMQDSRPLVPGNRSRLLNPPSLTSRSSILDKSWIMGCQAGSISTDWDPLVEPATIFHNDRGITISWSWGLLIRPSTYSNGRRGVECRPRVRAIQGGSDNTASIARGIVLFAM